MIKMIFCLRRKEGISREEFQRYWLEDHAPRVKALAARTGMIRYVQSHTYTSRIGSAAASARGTGEDYDGVMEGWWESEEQMRAVFAAEGAEPGEILLKDELNFIDLERSTIFMTREHIIF